MDLDGRGSVGLDGSQDHVEIFTPARVDGGNRVRLLLEPVDPLLGRHDRDGLVIFVERQPGPRAAIVLGRNRFRREIVQPEVLDRGGVARLHVVELLFVEGSARDSQQQDHDPGMNDIAPITSLVATQERRKGRPDALVQSSHAGAHGAAVFLRDRRQHEAGESPAGDGPVAGREPEERDHRDRHRDPHAGRYDELSAQAGEARLAPGDQRPDSRHHHQQQREQPGEGVEVGRPEDPPHAARRLGEDREHGAHEDDEEQRHEDPVVDDEARLAREHTLELVRAAQLRQAVDQRRGEGDQHHDDVGEEDPAEAVRVGEGMDRLHDPAAREEGPEEAEPVGQPDQHQVPGLQHVALFLDHHRVDVGGPRDPRHQRRVLDRVPGPVAPPAEDLVRPAPPEHDPHREHAPGEERPASRRAEPGRAQLAGHERGECEREGQGEAGEARIQHDGMDHHHRMLEQGIQPVAIREAVLVRDPLEGERLEVREPEEERDVGQHRDADPGHQRAVLMAIAEHRHRAIRGQHPAPEQQGPGLSAPECTESIVQRHRARGVLRDIGEREVVGRERPEECEHGDGGRGEDQQERALGDARPLRMLRDAGVDA